MCVLRVRDMYIHQCRHAPEHTRIHILMPALMYVEVWNIMVCNLDVPDPNKNEQTPDVVRKRLCRLSDSWEHIVVLLCFVDLILRNLTVPGVFH